MDVVILVLNITKCIVKRCSKARQETFMLWPMAFSSCYLSYLQRSVEIITEIGEKCNQYNLLFNDLNNMNIEMI